MVEFVSAYMKPDGTTHVLTRDKNGETIKSFYVKTDPSQIRPERKSLLWSPDDEEPEAPTNRGGSAYRGMSYLNLKDNK